MAAMVTSPWVPPHSTAYVARALNLRCSRPAALSGKVRINNDFYTATYFFFIVIEIPWLSTAAGIYLSAADYVKSAAPR